MVGTVYVGTSVDGENENFWGEDCSWDDANELLFHWIPPQSGSYRIEVVPSGPSSMQLGQFDDSCWVQFDCEARFGCPLAGIGMNVLVVENGEEWNLVLEGIDTDFELQIAKDESIPCEGETGTGTGGELCPYTNDGECDEPEGTDLCPEGTDATDCGG